MPTIVAVAHCVASSGVEAVTRALQHGGPNTLTQIIRSGSINMVEQIMTPGGTGITENVLGHGGTSMTERIITASGTEASADVNLVLFDPDFSRATNLFQVIGTSGSVPHFFDHSPFFHSPSEVDPNMMRDFSQALQLMVYTETTIFGFSNFQKTSGTAHLITVKGDEFNDTQLSFDDIVINGSFESGFGAWAATASGGGTITVEAPSGGADPYLTITPPGGSLYLRVLKPTANPNAIQIVRQTFGLGDPEPSSLLESLFFQAAIRSVLNIANFRGAVFLRFFREGVEVFLLRLQFTQFSAPAAANLPVELRFPDDDGTITGTFVAANFVTFSAQNLFEQMERESFSFDQVEVVFAFGTQGATAFDVKIDLVQLTLDLPEEDLLRTRSIAHILTGHPVASGGVLPFTIEDSTDIIITDETGPIFASQSPAPDTTFNPTTDRNITFHIQDLSSAVDQATIDVFVDGLQVVNNGVVITGSLWPTIVKTVLNANDVQYQLTRFADFPYQSTVVVSGTFADSASPANGTIDDYDFTYWGAKDLGATISGESDGTPPVITPSYPADGEVQVSPDASLSWSITDNSAGVDPTSLKLYINGSLVVDEGVALTGDLDSTPNSGRGFDYSYLPAENFGFGQTITGTIQVDDYAFNSASLEYSFTITPAATLEIVNFFLGANESIPLVSGGYGSVEVRDLTYGVASGTTYLLQNGEPPIGLLTTYSGAGPDRIFFTWPLEPNVDFREDLIIHVHAENKFPGPFPVIEDEVFTLQPGFSVFWPNKDPSGLSIAETVFPYLTNIFTNSQVKNFAVNFATGSDFTRFLTENQAFSDLGAFLESNINVADLGANVNVLSPHFAYGKEMTLEVEVADLQGNTLSFTHVFTIEDME